MPQEYGSLVDDCIEPDRSEARSSHKVKVLIVDDKPESLLSLEAMLSRLRCEIVKAGSGREALKVMLEQEIGLVMLDVQMPRLDGYETARLIRERHRTRGVPIIFLTAYHKADADIAHGYAFGAIDYVFKPVVPDILLAKVESLVALAERTQALQRKNAELLRAQHELRETKHSAKELETQLRKQNQVLVELAKSTIGQSRNVTAALMKIAVASANALEVERVAFWFLKDTAFVCEELYERDLDRHSAGLQFDEASVRRHLDRLEHERTLVLDQLEAEVSLHASWNGVGIKALLQAPIRLLGQVIGVVSFEDGSPRSWSLEEHYFISSAADIVALTLESLQRLDRMEAHERVVRDLERSKAELERSQRDLQEKVRDLEQFEEVVVGREMKMIALERENQQLRHALSRLAPDLQLPGPSDQPIESFER